MGKNEVGFTEMLSEYSDGGFETFCRVSEPGLPLGSNQPLFLDIYSSPPIPAYNCNYVRIKRAVNGDGWRVFSLGRITGGMCLYFEISGRLRIKYI